MLDDILACGFFPKELPPPFHSADLRFLSSFLPRSWRPNQKGTIKEFGDLERYNYRRVGYLRRRLAFPNPILFYHLANVVAENWPALRTRLSKGTWSVSRPTRIRPRGRAFAVNRRSDSIPHQVAKVRETSRYVLTADVARFYPSIYTHSVPWALHSRTVAKSNFDPMATLGNKLDYWLRMGQGRQTVGLPIGPDTSWLISELILVAVEEAFNRRFGRQVPGFRLIDDIQLGFRSLPEAEQALADLEAAMNEFELSLNSKKTSIRKLPALIGSAWPESIATFTFRPGPGPQATDLVRYFNLVFENSESYPEDHVIKYAVSRLSSFRIADANWPLYQSLLLQCMTVEPGCLPSAEAELRRQRAKGRVIDIDALSRCLETIIESAATLGHSSEVAWAIWVAIMFDARLSSDSGKLVSSMADSCSALVALHAESAGVFATPLDRSVWMTTQTSDSLWASNWLLSYEANKQGWLTPAGNADHVAADPHFKELKSRGVSFYDSRLAPAPAGTGHVRFAASGYPMLW